MARVRREGRERRAGLRLEDLHELSDDELVQLSIDAPGKTTIGGAEWSASPSFGVEAHRILCERGVW